MQALEAEVKDLQQHTETEDGANDLIVRNARDLDIQILRLGAEVSLLQIFRSHFTSRSSPFIVLPDRGM